MGLFMACVYLKTQGNAIILTITIIVELLIFYINFYILEIYTTAGLKIYDLLKTSCMPYFIYITSSSYGLVLSANIASYHTKLVTKSWLTKIFSFL